MALSDLFARVLAPLFGANEASREEPAERELVDSLTEAVVEAVEPRLRLMSRYKDRLRGPMHTTFAHLRALGQGMDEPLTLTRAGWAEDARVNAFFAAPDDIASCVGRSRELRAFFETNAAVSEAFALLGMTMSERKVLAPGLVGEVLMHDVAQITVSFSDHRIVAPSHSAAETRLEVGKRVVDRLAGAARSRVIALRGKAKSAATLEDYLGEVNGIFEHPDEHVALSRTPLRVSRLGVKVDASSTERTNDLVLTTLSVGEALRPVIALVRCPRAEMPAKGDLLAKAERYL